MQAAEFLSSTRLFSRLKPEELGILAGRVREVTLPDGAVVSEGSPPDGLYIIKSGVARVTKSSDTGSAEAVLAILRRTDSFGEISLIDGLPRSASVTAMGRLECYFLDRKRFTETLQQHPTIALSLIRALAAMVRSADDWVVRSI